VERRTGPGVTLHWFCQFLISGETMDAPKSRVSVNRLHPLFVAEVKSIELAAPISPVDSLTI
jgi:hypothetical protein